MEKVDPKNVLLVDDHQSFLATLAEGLRDCNSNDFCILTAENGTRALEVLGSTHVDLVVTDLKMPVMDGLELISHMKEKYPGIPVLVMSSFLCPDLETRLRALGASRCIEKASLRISSLEEMIFEHC